MQERRTLGYLKEDDIPSSAVKCEFKVGEKSGKRVYSGNVVYVPILLSTPKFKVTYTNPNYNISYAIRIASPDENYVYYRNFFNAKVGYGDTYSYESLAGFYCGYEIPGGGPTVRLVPCAPSQNSSNIRTNMIQDMVAIGSYVKLTFDNTINVRLGNDSFYGSNYGSLPIESISNYDYPLYIDTE